MDDGIYVTAIIRGEEWYIVINDAARRGDALRQLGLWAANDELGFSWYDAAIASQQIRWQGGGVIINTAR